MRVLAIETSCDETSAAVVEDRHRVLSNVVASQVEVHRRYGGVVPELASRCHIEAVDPTVRTALREADCALREMDAVAVTYGPGLVGSLLVGLSFAKALAFSLEKPLVGVNHLEGHIRSAFLEAPDIAFPAVALVVSGGHTALYHLPAEGRYRLLARTRDDAAGEAFDKVAKLVGLGYPGGPVIDRLAPTGDERRFLFPLPRMADGSMDFSFSGLKTAALRFAQSEGLVAGWPGHPEVADQRGAQGSPQGGQSLSEASPPQSPQGGQSLSEASPPQSPPDGEVPPLVRDLCASFQRAAVRLLVERTVRAARQEGVRSVILAGGVACNSRLRADLASACAETGWALKVPRPVYCTDNAAMIAAAAFLPLERGESSPLDLNADPVLRLGGPENARRTLRHK
jgi:N6-L-threonylcarbamoyladenine synthase